MMEQAASIAAPSAAAVRVERVRHRFGAVVALEDVSLEVSGGEFVALLGPSGSGKTTLLRIIAGLTLPTAGSIFIDGRDVTTLPTQARGVGFVFQSYALFPHLSVFENVAYPLRIRRFRGAELRRRVGAALGRVNLPDHGHRYPAELSGGQQQRAAVARALVYEPAVLLMDEPLGALDRKLRRHMQGELRLLQQALGITCIYVTHDQDEALTMADRVAVMHGGRILQVDSPMGIYRNPANRFVADFVGSMNFFTCVVQAREGEAYALKTGSGIALRAVSREQFPIGASVQCAIRPERIHLPADRTLDTVVTATVRRVSFAGSLTEVLCELAGGEMLSVQRGSAGANPAPGETMPIGWAIEDATLFPAPGGPGFRPAPDADFARTHTAAIPAQREEQHVRIG